MKDIFRWLETKLLRSKPVNPPTTFFETKPEKTELDLPKDMQDLVTDAPPPGGINDEDGDTVPDLSLDDQSLSDTDKET